MEVVKRNGNLEPVYFDKISNRLRKLCINSELENLDHTIIAQKTIQNLYDGITTQELDELSARVCATLGSKNPLYNNFGGKICISNLQKMTPNTFFEAMEKLMDNIDVNGDVCPLLNEDFFHFIEQNNDEIQSHIIIERDYFFDYFGFKTLERAYLMKSNGVIVETPQYMWMRVALGIHRNDLKSAFETYDLMSTKFMTHASPTLFNAGTTLEQLSSCFLVATDDSIEGIFKTITDCAYISKNAGGIGIHVSNIRANGSLIRSTNGNSSGIIPMLQVYNYTARYINQGGRRPGSFAIYLEPWHGDIFEFLDLRKNTGSETERARDLFLALWIPDLFMEHVRDDLDWYLMCPDMCPKLNEVYGDKFNELYMKYVIEGKYLKKIKARQLWTKIIEAQIETGNPYMSFKDTANRKSNQKNIGIIKSSNLCNEIYQVSSKKETAVCNLNSIALNMFIKNPELNDQIIIYSKEGCPNCKLAKMLIKNYNLEYEEIEITNKNNRMQLYMEISEEHDILVSSMPQIYIGDKYIGGYEDFKKYMQPTYDFEKLKEVSKICCQNLNKIIDINYYPIPEAYCSNILHRPIGIGVQGLANAYFKMRFPFESDEAHELNKEIFATIYYGALEASIEISKERGEKIEQLLKTDNRDYSSFEWNELSYKLDGSYDSFEKEINRDYAKGAYSSFIGSPFSYGELQFDLWETTPNNRWDWDLLKDNMRKYGTRNSLLTALMPTASTSQILGNNECFEAITSNIYTRRTQAGEFKIINKYLIEDLTNYGLWTDQLKDLIIYHNGSIQQIEEIPIEIRELYKTVWEIKQKHVIMQSAERGIYIDQSQSMNIFMEDADFEKITSSHFTSWQLGLKTGMYYFRTKPGASASKVTIEHEICESCSG